MSRSRVGALVASGALASAAILGGASAAQAQQTEGPVQFSAEGNDQCEVTFEIINHTNSKHYTIDYLIDGEAATGTDHGTGPTGRTALRSDADDPVFPGSGYVSDREPVTSEVTVNLRELDDLPHPDADAHNIQYRMILGPDGNHRGNGQFHNTSVTGCASDEDSGFIGSLIGSVDLFGSLSDS